MTKSKFSRKDDAAKDLVLGLNVFEQISAVEGVRLSGAMKRDLVAINNKPMTAAQRRHFLKEKYGKTSA